MPSRARRVAEVADGLNVSARADRIVPKDNIRSAAHGVMTCRRKIR
jgi:hypothetical protein